ncbi:putative pumilio21 [Sesamum angolense]|uniref:Pumilio21 n=1 Tax=Sesamum angolense TaxID=2727404 RepID=A0AAE1WV97_9LAMI|nr:putative pumilio21 [Sesamum angolense]
MDSQSSQTSLNPTDHDVEEFIQYIECLRRGKYVSLRQAPTANSQSNGGDDDSDTSTVFSFKTQEDGIPITTTTSKKIVPCVLGQDSSATKDSIWGCPRFFMTTSPGEKDMRNDQNLMDDSEQEESLVSILEDSVLYEKVILHFHDLAIDKVGCASLIYCIALIGGDQRVRLLDQIADVSDFLSYDPYGNYVVQNLLGLKNEDVTKKIMSRLQNEIMGLAKRRGGCLVVEKCMEASDDGIITVAMEILDRGRAALRLAGNQFGNYVIEAVLKKTKERGFNSLYNAIVGQMEAGRGGSAGRNKIN